MLCSLNEYVIIPATISYISSRSECNIRDEYGKLPLFAAPMSSVIDDTNYQVFEKLGVNTVIPRTVDFDKRLELMTQVFCAFSLDEFEKYFLETDRTEERFKVCVDVANGHMDRLISMCSTAKDKYRNKLILMTGNIANPKTYDIYARANIDYVRVGIGSGNVCTTSANTGIHFPMGSLLESIKREKEALNFTDCKHRPKIIADGGFVNFDQINKALALGADYVMIGKLFAECEEACGEIYNEFKAHDRWTEEDKKHLVFNEKSGTYMTRIRDYYGMSTKFAQSKMGKTDLKTAEGIEKMVYVKYTLESWISNFSAYLRSAMSYTNCTTLNEFKTKVKLEKITPTAFNSYFK